MRRYCGHGILSLSGNPDCWDQSQTAIARDWDARQHGVSYLILGDGTRRLENEYFRVMCN